MGIEMWNSIFRWEGHWVVRLGEGEVETQAGEERKKFAYGT